MTITTTTTTKTNADGTVTVTEVTRTVNPDGSTTVTEKTQTAPSATVVGVVANDGDLEAQPIKNEDFVQPAPAAAAVKSTTIVASDIDSNAGQGLGIAMIVLQILSLIFTIVIYLGIIAFITNIATIVVSSIIVCRCCCTREYNLPRNRHRFAVAVLSCVCLTFIIWIAYIVVAGGIVANQAATSITYTSSGGYDYDYSSFNSQAAQTVTVGGFVAWIIQILLNVLSIIFASLYTCGGKCCAS